MNLMQQAAVAASQANTSGVIGSGMVGAGSGGGQQVIDLKTSIYDSKCQLFNYPYVHEFFFQLTATNWGPHAAAPAESTPTTNSSGRKESSLRQRKSAENVMMFLSYTVENNALI